jgi:hypothetical protein
MLPSDIILIIFTMLSDIEDVVMFALTCSTFWITGKTRLCAVREQHVMLWSGCRIVCYGDKGNNAPPGMLTDVDYQELKAYAATTGQEDDPLRVLVKFLDHKSTTLSIPSEQEGGFSFYKLGYYSIERRALKALRDRPLLRSPVLRNLTKREYIRQDRNILAKLRRVNLLVLGRGNMLGLVLLTRICWSSDPSIDLEYDGGLHRGEWAGDRVDCVEFQDFKKDLSGQSDDQDGEQRPWKDITKEAWGLLVDIYAAMQRASGFVLA